MTRSKLIEALAKAEGISLKAAETAIEVTLESIAKTHASPYGLVACLSPMEMLGGLVGTRLEVGLKKPGFTF